MVKQNDLLFRVALFFVCFESAFGATVPDFLKVCRRSDPKLAACIKKSVEDLKPSLIKGIPELNIPALDPFKLDNIVIFDGQQVPNLKASLANLEITGLSNFEVTKIKLDVDKKIYRVGIKVPFIEMQTDYDVDSKLFGAQVKSAGNVRANATGIEANAVLHGAVDENNHLQIESIVLKIRVDDFGLNLDNVLNEDPVLKQAAQQFLNNANKKDLVLLAAPYIETRCSEILLQMSNEVLKNLDYDEIFPA